MNDKNSDPEEFLKASKRKDTGIFREFLDFLSENKKWWMLPIIIIMILLGVIIILGNSALAPFIYTLF